MATKALMKIQSDLDINQPGRNPIRYSRRYGQTVYAVVEVEPHVVFDFCGGDDLTKVPRKKPPNQAPQLPRSTVYTNESWLDR